MRTRARTIFATALFATAWIAAVSFGARALLRYENAPGKVGSVPSMWPAGSRITPATKGETLVMVAHPQCPCTRASISELAEIMAQLHGKIHAYVLFLKPHNSDSDWDDTDLRRAAAAIPDVTAMTDLDGLEAKRFGAETSGHTLLFAANGELLFNGGITESRGHEGDNAGKSSIVSLVNEHQAARRSTFVFGCSLNGPARKEAKQSCPN